MADETNIDGIDKIATALAKAQAAFEPITQDRLVEVRTEKGKYDFRYATLHEIIAKTRDGLTKNGIAFTQRVIGSDSVETVLMHESGQRLVSEMPVIVAQGRGHPAQALGGAVSYARRYGLAAALGVAGDDDSDAEAAETAAAMAEAVSKPNWDAKPKSADKGPWTGPLNRTALRNAYEEFDKDLRTVGSLDEFIALKENDRPLIDQIEIDRPDWFEGKDDIVGLKYRIRDKEKALTELEDMTANMGAG